MSGDKSKVGNKITAVHGGKGMMAQAWQHRCGDKGMAAKVMVMLLLKNCSCWAFLVLCSLVGRHIISLITFWFFAFVGLIMSVAAF